MLSYSCPFQVWILKRPLVSCLEDAVAKSAKCRKILSPSLKFLWILLSSCLVMSIIQSMLLLKIWGPVTVVCISPSCADGCLARCCVLGYFHELMCACRNIQIIIYWSNRDVCKCTNPKLADDETVWTHLFPPFAWPTLPLAALTS